VTSAAVDAETKVRRQRKKTLADLPAVAQRGLAACLQAFLRWAVKDSNLRPWD
jgi:hypothetical protein